MMQGKEKTATAEELEELKAVVSELRQALSRERERSSIERRRADFHEEVARRAFRFWGQSW